MVAGPPSGQNDPWIGRNLGGRYRVTRPLGSGGAGAVYEAREGVIGRMVAVKILHPELAADAVQLGRFRREARAAGAIGHPNIAQLIDFADVRPNEPAFLVLELVAGRSLAEIMTREPVMRPPRAVGLASQILAGLDAAHQAGVVHRDLKPGNVVVAEQGGTETCKLVDFGIAQMHESNVYLKLTRTGVIVGTPRYMSPEQASGRDMDPRTDLWAVGVILYRMLTGAFPFDGRPDQVIIQIVKGDVPPMDPMLRVPAPLEAAVRRALEKKPDGRWPSALAMQSAIRAAIGEIPATAEARLPPRREEARTQELRVSVEPMGVGATSDRTVEEPRSSFEPPRTSAMPFPPGMGASPSVVPPVSSPGIAASSSPGWGVATSSPGVASSPGSAPTSWPSGSAPAPATRPARTPVSRIVLILVGAVLLGLGVTGCLLAPWIGAAVGLWEWSHGGCTMQ